MVVESRESIASLPSFNNGPIPALFPLLPNEKTSTLHVKKQLSAIDRKQSIQIIAKVFEKLLNLESEHVKKTL